MKRRRRSGILFVTLLHGSTSCFAFSDAPEAWAQKIDSLCLELDKPTPPGCALGVAQDGNSIYRRAYGMGSLEFGAPLTPAPAFRAFS